MPFQRTSSAIAASSESGVRAASSSAPSAQPCAIRRSVAAFAAESRNPRRSLSESAAIRSASGKASQRLPSTSAERPNARASSARIE